MSFSQQTYRSADQIELEWEGYTKFQRDEMASFCDFLFNEGYYERCLISSFQFLYSLPYDAVMPSFFHLLARSYVVFCIYFEFTLFSFISSGV